MTIPFLWVPVTALACYTVLLAALLPARTALLVQAGSSAAKSTV